MKFSNLLKKALYFIFILLSYFQYAGFFNLYSRPTPAIDFDNFKSFYDHPLISDQNNCQNDCDIYTKISLIGPYEANITREKAGSFLELGGKINWRKIQPYFLCKLKILSRCTHVSISEMHDRVMVFAPVYRLYPNRSKEYLDHHFNFLGIMKTMGFKTNVVEAIILNSNQSYVVTSPNNEPWEYQVNISYPFYARENLLNVGVKKTMDLDLYDYIIYIDAHQVFENTYWWEEGIYKMERHTSVQLFSTLAHLKQDNKSRFEFLHSTMYKHTFTRPIRGTAVWAGNAWGIKLEDYRNIGYVLDTCIAGACDYSLCMANMENITDWVDNIMPNYYSQLSTWIEQAHKSLGKGGVVKGYLAHLWHNSMFDYFRLQIELHENNISFARDLYRDADFIIRFNSSKLEKIFSRVDFY